MRAAKILDYMHVKRLARLLLLTLGAALIASAGRAQYTRFTRAMDVASTFSGIGQCLGLFRITPDALRGAARLFGAGGVDPLAYALDVDAGLRERMGSGDWRDPGLSS